MHLRPWAKDILGFAALLFTAASAYAVPAEFVISAVNGVVSVNGGPASAPGPLTLTGFGDTDDVVVLDPGQFALGPAFELPLQHLFFSSPVISGEFPTPALLVHALTSPGTQFTSMGGTDGGSLSLPPASWWSAPFVFHGVLTHFTGPLPLLTLTTGTSFSYRYVTLPGDPLSDDNVLHLTWQPLAGAPEPGTIALFVAGLVLLISAKWRLDSTWAASPSTCGSS